MFKKKSTLIVLGIAVVILGFVFYPGVRSSDAPRSVPCLLPNLSLVQHLHPTLAITVDGEPETVPANIGLSQTCERAIHTHDPDGVIHVEAQDRRAYTFGDFLWVWNKNLNRDGYALDVFVDGERFTENLAELEFEDRQAIELRYATPGQ